MNMHISFFKHININTQRNRMRFHNRISSLNRFFHHIAQLTCLFYSSFTRHINGFNKQYITTKFCPSKSCCHTNNILLFFNPIVISLNPQIILEIIFINHNIAFFFTFKHNTFNRFTSNRSNLFFQTSNPGFRCIITNNINYCLIRNHQFTRLNPIFSKHLRY